MQSPPSSHESSELWRWHTLRCTGFCSHDSWMWRPWFRHTLISRKWVGVRASHSPVSQLLIVPCMSCVFLLGHSSSLSLGIGRRRTHFACSVCMPSKQLHWVIEPCLFQTQQHHFHCHRWQVHDSVRWYPLFQPFVLDLPWLYTLPCKPQLWGHSVKEAVYKIIYR